jgi:hypothetical protein
MGRNRKTFTDTFKKEVAIEAIKVVMIPTVVQMMCCPI